MEAARLIGCAARVELEAAEIYTALAARFASDESLRGFWQRMAADERLHARKLGTWQRLLDEMPADDANLGSYAKGLDELKRLVESLRARVGSVATVEDAFAIALELETSELDVIYATLLQASPIARFPDVADTRTAEVGRHHDDLVEMVRRRSHDERNLMMAALLAAEQP